MIRLITLLFLSSLLFSCSEVANKQKTELEELKAEKTRLAAEQQKLAEGQQKLAEEKVKLAKATTQEAEKVKNGNTEQFNTVDPAKFNASIANKKDIQSAEQLITLYYNYPSEEGTPKLSITKVPLKHGRVNITLIHDKMLDDSQRGFKILMTAQQKDGIWTVSEIKTNHKCWEGRGHTDWGTENCI